MPPMLCILPWVCLCYCIRERLSCIETITLAVFPFQQRLPPSVEYQHGKLHPSSELTAHCLRSCRPGIQSIRTCPPCLPPRCAAQAAPQHAAVGAERLAEHVFPEAANSLAVIVDGVLRPELSRLSGMQASGVYIGGLTGASAAALESMVRSGINCSFCTVLCCVPHIDDLTFHSN